MFETARPHMYFACRHYRICGYFLGLPCTPPQITLKLHSNNYRIWVLQGLKFGPTMNTPNVNVLFVLYQYSITFWGLYYIRKLCLGSWGLQSTKSTGVLGQHQAIQE